MSLPPLPVMPIMPDWLRPLIEKPGVPDPRPVQSPAPQPIREKEPA